MEDYKAKFERLMQRIDDLIANGWIDENVGKAILKDFAVESEDERMRKELISLVKETHVTDRFYDLNKMLAWLEKQGEQKSEINDNILLRFAFYQYDDDIFYLSSVFVEECNRKHGYGTKILKAAENVAKTFGVSKIRLKVERNTWMEEWYKKNGYEYLSPDGEYDWLEKRVEQKQHLELKAGHWYFCHQAYCERADILTVKEGDRFKCEKDGIVKGLIIKEPEKYFREISTPSDKVEPKFKVGDWIVYNKQINCTNYIMRINKVGLTDYQCQYNNGLASYRFDFVDKNYRLWTIQDAKDGDVLSWDDSNCIAIFSRIETDELFISHGFIGNITGEFEKGCGVHSITNHLHPATKEQRDFLFQKMKEAGYKWDVEKKELKRIGFGIS